MFNKVKEIRSKTGELHFTRWRIFSIPKWNINLYLHRIAINDLDKHPHDHPWNYITFIIKGGYVERCNDRVCIRQLFDISRKKATETHKIVHLLGKVCYTLVFTYGKKRTWGYQTEKGWIDHVTYRFKKRNNDL